MPFCSSCGKKNFPEAAYCSSCGAPLREPSVRVEINNNFGRPVDRSELIRCANCGGTGIDHKTSLFGQTCKVCGGVGKVRISKGEKELVVCPTCNGKGVDYRHVMMGVTCKRCSGTGKVLV